MKNNLLPKFSSGRAALAAASLALFTGCATTGGYDSYNTARADHPSTMSGGQYAPGDRLFRGRHLDEIHPRNTTLEEAQLKHLADFQGIEGARLAHRLYASHAEDLDGACEAQVKVAQGESLWDIAEYCDVSIFVLSDFNASVGSSSELREGQVLNIPHANVLTPTDLPRSGLGGANNVSFGDGIDSLPLSPILKSPSVYHVAAGDTLTEIARNHNVSAATLANLNPDLDWRFMPVGAAVLIPAQRIENKAYVHSPKKPSVKRSDILEISRTAVKPGAEVSLAARGLPALTAISVYRGPNRREMELVGEFVTNEAGELYADARVKKSSNLGGVIFAASVGDDYLYSPRVNVVKLKNETAK